MENLPGCVLVNVFSLLDPYDLGRCTGVCSLWKDLITSQDGGGANFVWRRFYRQRWQVTSHECSSWYTQFGAKMQQIKNWSGRYQADHLHGHAAGVKCARLLPSHNLLATGSLDKTIRLWNLSTGMPVAVSKSQGGTVRCLALDDQALLSGSTDHNIRVWLPRNNDTPAPASSKPAHKASHQSRQASLPLFNLAGPPDLQLVGHTGPVSAMCLTEHTLYSGSWDYSVRIWDRASWKCRSVLSFDDWVGSLAVRGNHLLVAAGPVVAVHDTCTGQVVRKFQDLHEGHVSCLEGTHNNRLMFTGSTDGLVLAHDLRMREATRVLWHHNAAVQGLSYEDPWLATASADGTLTMINTQQCMSHRAGDNKTGGSGSGGVAHGGLYGRCLTAGVCRQFHTNGGPALCVDLADQFLVCGAESPVVRIWDFSHAAEAAARAEAAKQARQAARAARQHAPPGALPHSRTALLHQEHQEQAGAAGQVAGGEQLVGELLTQPGASRGKGKGKGHKDGWRRAHNHYPAAAAGGGGHQGALTPSPVAPPAALLPPQRAEAAGSSSHMLDDHMHHTQQRGKRSGASRRHRAPHIPAYMPTPQSAANLRHTSAGPSGMHVLPGPGGSGSGGAPHGGHGGARPAKEFTYLQLSKPARR